MGWCTDPAAHLSRGKLLKMAWTAFLCAVGLSLTVPAMALADSARFDIAAQPLPQALKAFAAQSHMQLLYRYSAVANAKGNAVSGDLEKHAALEQLLRDSGLEVIYSSDSAATIRPARATAVSNVRNSDPPSGGGAQAPPTGDSLRLAQATPGQTSSTPTVEQKTAKASDNSVLQEVLVTAQKREERLQNVPISISVLSGGDLDKSTFEGASDALNTVPGVSATKAVQGAGTQIVVRGIGAGGPLFSGSSPVAYYLDSVPFGFVKMAAVPDPNIYDLQRIEVLRGPQGTLYGANAENGVVRVLTNDANPDAFELKARSLISTTDGGGANYGGDVAVNVPLVEGKLAVRGVVDYQNMSGWVNGPVGNHINDAQLQSFRLKVNARPTEQLAIGLSASSTHNDYGAPSVSTDDRRISAVIPEPISTDYNVFAFRLGYEFRNFSLSNTASYIDYKDKGVLDLGIYGADYVPLLGIPVYSDFYSRVFSDEVILNSAPDSSWRWTAGAIYRHVQDRTYQDVPGLLPAPIDYTDRSSSYAAFGQIGRHFLDEQFEWALGLRSFHDDVLSKENVQGQGLANVPLIEDSASFNSTTPRAVLTWHPNAAWAVYSSFSQGFRSGSPQTPTALHAAPDFPAVQPDKLYNYEVGAKADLAQHRLSLEVAFFYIDWKDVQQLITVPIGNQLFLSALVNGHSASGVGADFALTARPIDGLQLSVNAGWNGLKMNADVMSGGALLFSKGDRLNYSPEFTGGASADYTFPVGGGFSGRFSVSGSYSSKQTDHLLHGVDAVVNTGDALVNVRLGVSLMSPGNWSATLFVDNATNDYGSIPAFGFPSPEQDGRARPRTAGVQVDCKF